MSKSFNSYLTNLFEWFAESFSGSRKGIEDTVVSLIPQAVTLLAGIITSVLIARGLGPVGMGQYALISSISGLAAIFSDLGIGNTAIRFASQSVSHGDTVGQLAVLRWAFRLRMLLLITLTVVIFWAIPFLADKIWNIGNLIPLMRLSLFIGIFGTISSIPIIYFQSLKRFKMNTAVSVGQTLLSFSGIMVIAFLNKWTLQLIIMASILASGIASVVFLSLVPKSAVFNAHEFHVLFKSKFKHIFHLPTKDLNTEITDDIGINAFAIYMVLSAIVVQLTLRADIWLMGLYLDKSQIGLYNVATKFALPLGMVLGAINTALWPRASALTSRKKTTEMLKKTFRLSAILAFCVSIYALSAPKLTPYIFGIDYADGVLLGQILCLRYCLAILICPIGVIGYSMGLVRTYWLVNLIQMIVVVCINIILLPRIGVMGAVIALIANETVGFVIFGTIISRKILSWRSY